MRKLLITFSLLFCLYGCDPLDKRLTLVNKSRRLIFYSTSANDSIRGRSPLNYSFKIEKSDTIWDEGRNLVLPDSSKLLTIIGSKGWESYINKHCKDSILRVFVFEKKLIGKQPWDSLVMKGLYTKKYSYKVKDLEKLNWRIEYKE